MHVKPIKTEADYQWAIQRLEVLFDAKKVITEGDELEILSILIKKYESDQCFIDMPDPIEAIQFRMEQQGVTQSDLATVFSQKSRASEILSRKRKLSLKMIRQIHHCWQIPTNVLVQAY